MEEEENISNSQSLQDVTSISPTDNDEIEIDFIHGFMKKEHITLRLAVALCN